MKLLLSTDNIQNNLILESALAIYGYLIPGLSEVYTSGAVMYNDYITEVISASVMMAVICHSLTCHI